mmetsp:Transcript_28574/g.42234  ORF Transcript_28574/g.42234 Transcript_28574/m.42234 type:complete len:274 (+) Transcript_28574:41-862(+)|eukprot:CAMPEP_0194213442 /NCGR_PEP_ID=MMETSP0156-20130528/14046_1 /TAXON_ID=33649 /ORGANISM="Thalassionema nitzschioides, Strain L26-B" /LENGTH=273 /DNA_ID=CAMNT_0038941471 /DNA_START=32 /DNA_END=853 /DNA_ORIENTATION=+
MMRSVILRGSKSLSHVNRRFLSSSVPDVTLYQYHICPFCHKAKAVMGYADIQPNQLIEVNPLTKAELKGLSDDYHKVPIAVIDGVQVNGSGNIIKALLANEAVKETILSKSSSLGSWEDFDSASSSNSWEEFANEDLGSILYPNICSSLGDSYNAFGYVHRVESFSTVQKFSIQAIGSLAMYFAASRIKAKRGIDDERAALQTALQKWQEEALSNGSKIFSSGKNDPNLNDLLVYGTLRSVEGLSIHTEVLNQSENSILNDWYLRVKDRLIEF